MACTFRPGCSDHPPGTIAVVAFEEAPTVRFTATLVDRDPGQIQVGLPVQVGFQQSSRNWVLRLGAGRVDLDHGAESRHANIHRAPRRRFEDDVAIVGIGRSPLGREPGTPSAVPAVEAARAAIADAGLAPTDIDGVCGLPGAVGLPGVSAGGFRELAQSLDLHPIWHAAGREIAGTAGAVLDSMLAVTSGLCRHVLCFTAAPVGVARRPVGGDAAGPLSSTSQVALAASEYLARYGVSRAALGWVAIAAHRHAGRNPDALWRDPIDMDDYLSAAPVSSPLGLLDCGLPGDGVMAVVISAAEYAMDRPEAPIWVDAVGTRHLPRRLWEVGLDSHKRALDQSAEQLWTRARTCRQDVDLIVVNDSFTFDVLCWLEALGICGPGEAGDFVLGGRRIGPDGVLPVNPHGGQLAAGGTGSDIYEAVVQLRGQADGRQIPGARVAVACSRDADSASAMLLHTER